jgi:hypothetical protein
MIIRQKGYTTRERWDESMHIHSDSYKVAALSGQEDAVEIIRQAEAAIAQLTGNTAVTLIAYEKTEASSAN